MHYTTCTTQHISQSSYRTEISAQIRVYKYCLYMLLGIKVGRGLSTLKYDARHVRTLYLAAAHCSRTTYSTPRVQYQYSEIRLCNFKKTYHNLFEYYTFMCKALPLRFNQAAAPLLSFVCINSMSYPHTYLRAPRRLFKCAAYFIRMPTVLWPGRPVCQAFLMSHKTILVLIILFTIFPAVFNLLQF